MLVEIFSYLEPVEQQRARSVCSTWDNLLGELFDVELRLRSPNDSKVMIRTSARSLTAKVYHTNFSVELSQLQVFVSFANRLQKLELHGAIRAETIDRLLKQSTNLKELTFNKVQVEGIGDARNQKWKGRSGTNRNWTGRRVLNWLPELTSLRFVFGMDILGLDDSQEKLLILLANILENGKLAKLIIIIIIIIISLLSDIVAIAFTDIFSSYV
jgi:hypothetical protein